MLATRQDRSRIQRELIRLRTYSFGSKFETQRRRVAITLGFIAFTTLIGLVLDDIGKVETTSPPPRPTHTPPRPSLSLTTWTDVREISLATPPLCAWGGAHHALH